MGIFPVEGDAPRPRTGLIPGNFLPPHAGHLHLIEMARGTVDESTALVCSLELESIPGAQQVAWL